MLFLYFSSKNNVEKLVYILLQYEIHFIEGLYVNLLISNDIISLEAMVIDLRKKTALIGVYKITINMNAK